ncbi:DEAD/DEAH box helicase [Oceanomicrobium pacificus]|uniref:DEAD/DEAH box helicase n=1 Tax=Oceanomicrobium pacificus TaxID=2692916 RepID=A0A6B0U7B2_9RHOB|nr:DEAD/DEAH box helicase [Oceanomicrobium pacificus]MXU66761.1 DEAD/DEAH box helicase [Oceanomicrobium pacificus]
MTTFSDLGLNKTLLKTLDRNKFETPTPIQAEAIPHVLGGRDVLGLAQTGTGKTAAFGLPLVHQLIARPEKPAPKAVHALVLAPTRELVNQIAVNMRSFVWNTPLKIGVAIGGASINAQVHRLSRGTDILVATPGRLLDLVERRAVDLSAAKFLVLDEADQMLDLGFIHALRRIAKLVGQERQTMLFSATMPKLIAELSEEYLTDPVRVEVSPPGRTADKIRQSVHYVDKAARTQILIDALSADKESLSLVFARTKRGAERLMKTLVSAGLPAASIHGNKSQGQRERALKSFRNGETRILVATDVAARGIDIPGVSHVYNFELPEVAENYVHRIGRTARAGRSGEAIAFCTPDEFDRLLAVESVIGMELPAIGGERPAEPAPAPRKPGRRRRGGGGNAGGNGQKPRQKNSRGAPQGQKPGGQKRNGPARKRKPQRRKPAA